MDLTTSAFDCLEDIVDIAFNRSELISEIKEKSPGDRREGNIADMKSELAFFEDNYFFLDWDTF